MENTSRIQYNYMECKSISNQICIIAIVARLLYKPKAMTVSKFQYL